MAVTHAALGDDVVGECCTSRLWPRRAAISVQVSLSIRRIANNRNAPSMVHSYATATASYRDAAVSFIKLLDGSMVDNYGVSSLPIARKSSDTPTGPRLRSRR